MKAYHFTNSDGTLGNGDGRRVCIGETLVVRGRIAMCRKGLHASQEVWQALKYAPDYRLWLVDSSAELVNVDKVCGRKRTALVDYGCVDYLVVEFAKWCRRRNDKIKKQMRGRRKSGDFKYLLSVYTGYSVGYYPDSVVDIAEMYGLSIHKTGYGEREKKLMSRWWKRHLDRIARYSE